jgi:hypothetical protein
MKIERVCIYPKDIVRITGKSERYSRDILKKIKAKLNKEDHHLVSVQEFCDYLGLNIEHVLITLK